MYNSDFQLVAHGPRVARQTIFDVTRKTFRVGPLESIVRCLHKDISYT